MKPLRVNIDTSCSSFIWWSPVPGKDDTIFQHLFCVCTSFQTNEKSSPPTSDKLGQYYARYPLYLKSMPGCWRNFGFRLVVSVLSFDQFTFKFVYFQQTDRGEPGLEFIPQDWNWTRLWWWFDLSLRLITKSHFPYLENFHNYWATYLISQGNKLIFYSPNLALAKIWFKRSQDSNSVNVT